MNVETLNTLATVFYTLAGVLLLTAVVLFFVLNIPKVFGIVTGLSAARGIKKFQDKITERNYERQTGKVSLTSPVSGYTQSMQTQKIATTKLNDHTQSATSKMPVITPEYVPVEDSVKFTVIQELSFTGTRNIIE